MICIDENQSMADSSPGHPLAMQPKSLGAPLGAHLALAGTKVGVVGWDGLWWWEVRDAVG